MAAPCPARPAGALAPTLIIDRLAPVKFLHIAALTTDAILKPSAGAAERVTDHEQRIGETRVERRIAVDLDGHPARQREIDADLE